MADLTANIHGILPYGSLLFEGRETGFEKRGIQALLKRYIFSLDLETRAGTQLSNAGRRFLLFLSRVCNRPSAEGEENDSHKP
jgi:hypothetical protein